VGAMASRAAKARNFLFRATLNGARRSTRVMTNHTEQTNGETAI
jgi:hypothetical protein